MASNWLLKISMKPVDNVTKSERKNQFPYWEEWLRRYEKEIRLQIYTICGYASPFQLIIGEKEYSYNAMHNIRYLRPTLIDARKFKEEQVTED